MSAALAAPQQPGTALLFSAADLLHAMRALRDALPLRLDLSGLNRVLRVDAERELIELQAATPWSVLAARLAPEHAWAAQLAAACGSIGDAVAENAPGPDGVPSVALVESLTVVTPDGELRRVSRELHAELFALAVGGQGVIAMPYSITLRIAALRAACEQPAPAVDLGLGGADTPCERLLLLAPPARSSELAAALRDRLTGWRIAPLGLHARPLRGEAETFLRWATRDYALLTLSLPRPQTIGQRVRLEQAMRELIDDAIACGGSFPISRTPAATRAQVEACYPMLREFLSEKRRQDPRECLVNAWYRHHRSLFSRESCVVKWAPEG